MFTSKVWAKKPQTFVLVDIGAASVGVGIVHFTNGKSKLLWHSRGEFTNEDMQDFTRYSRRMYSVLLAEGMKLASTGVPAVMSELPNFSLADATVVCVLGPPWFKGVTQSIVQEREKPFQVNDAVFENMRATMSSSVLRTPESLAWQDVMGEAEVLRIHIERVTLDGYTVQEYLGRSTKELTVHSYIELVSGGIQNKVEEVLRRVVPNHALYFSSSTRVLSHLTACNAKRTCERALLVEVSGPITSISLLQGAAVDDTITIPLGSNHFMQALVPEGAGTAEARGKLDVIAAKKEENILDQLPDPVQEQLAVWYTSMAKAVQTVSSGVTPPSKVVLVVGAFLYPFYEATLDRPWMAGSGAELTTEVSHLVGVLPTQKGTLRAIDSRLAILTRTIQDCVRRKQLCYTKKNP
jgi:hypothetical protein